MTRFEPTFEGVAPWDIGAPQPAVVRLVERGVFAGKVLEVGCGTGENALHLASKGHEVVGVDAAERAIDQARGKARLRGVHARFLVHDALSLGELRDRFDTVLDCGLFHVLNDEQRECYIRSLATVLRPGSMLYLLCFSDTEPGHDGPRRVSAPELIEAFRAPFAVEKLERTHIAHRRSPRGAAAWLATLVHVGHPLESNV